MVGELVEWPRAEMPQEIWPDCGMEFIPYMMQSFDPVKFPLLAQLHPTHVLPSDMRGNVPRGWDNARGIDTDRVLMSEQSDALQKITAAVVGGFFDGNSASFTGAFQAGEQTTQTVRGNTSTLTQTAFTFDSERVVRTASETRGRNIAWNMIVRAK